MENAAAASTVVGNISACSKYQEIEEYEGLTLYDIHRKPREQITDDRGVTLVMKSLNHELSCAVCLGILHDTMIVMECLHRFCGQCIQKCLRVGRKECPQCRIHIPSRRSLRPDPNFDALISKIYPNLEEFELQEEKMITNFNKRLHVNNAYASSAKEKQLQQQQQRLQHRGVKRKKTSNPSGTPSNRQRTASPSPTAITAGGRGTTTSRSSNHASPSPRTLPPNTERSANGRFATAGSSSTGGGGAGGGSGDFGQSGASAGSPGTNGSGSPATNGVARAAAKRREVAAKKQRLRRAAVAAALAQQRAAAAAAAAGGVVGGGVGGGAGGCTATTTTSSTAAAPAAALASTSSSEALLALAEMQRDPNSRTFVLRRRPGERRVCRLQRELIHASRTLQVRHVKELLSMRLGNLNAGQFQISVNLAAPIERGVYLTDDEMTLDDIYERIWMKPTELVLHFSLTDSVFHGGGGGMAAVEGEHDQMLGVGDHLDVHVTAATGVTAGVTAGCCGDGDGGGDGEVVGRLLTMTTTSPGVIPVSNSSTTSSSLTRV